MLCMCVSGKRSPAVRLVGEPVAQPRRRLLHRIPNVEPRPPSKGNNLVYCTRRSQLVEVHFVPQLSENAQGFAKSLPPQTFLDPFSTGLWISLLAAYVLTSLTLFFVARVSPYERRSTHDVSCFGNEGFSFCNAFWFTLTGFCLRGSNITPRVSEHKSTAHAKCLIFSKRAR